jgi:hypothetical protein
VTLVDWWFIPGALKLGMSNLKSFDHVLAIEIIVVVSSGAWFVAVGEKSVVVHGGNGRYKPRLTFHALLDGLPFKLNGGISIFHLLRGVGGGYCKWLLATVVKGKKRRRNKRSKNKKRRERTMKDRVAGRRNQERTGMWGRERRRKHLEGGRNSVRVGGELTKEDTLTYWLHLD